MWIALSRALPVMGYRTAIQWDQDRSICYCASSSMFGNQEYWGYWLAFDLDQNRWSISDAVDRSLFQPSAAQPPSYWSITDINPHIFEQRDSTSNQLLAKRELNIAGEIGSLVDGHYLLVIKNGIQWLDLDRPDSELQPLEAPRLPVLQPAGTPFNRVVDLNDGAFLAIRSLPSASEVALFRFNDQGVPQEIAQWQTLQDEASGFDQYIATVHPKLGDVEIRDKRDGSIVRMINFPIDMYPKANLSALVIENQWHLRGELLAVQRKNAWSYYDMRVGRWLHSPDSRSEMLSRSLKTNLAVFLVDNRDKIIFDEEQNRVLFTLPDSAANAVEVLDRDTTVVLDSKYGTSFHFYDNATGRWIRTYAPFAHAPYSTVLLLAIFVGWCVLWLRASVPAGTWVWLDVMLVVAVPLAMLSWRAALGPVWDLARPTFSYALGLALGMTLPCCLWLILSKYRWPIRVLPLLLLEAALLVDFRLIFGSIHQLIEIGMLNVNLPAGLLLIPLISLAVMGVRWRRDTTSEESGLRGRMRLSDLFLLTIAVALVMAAAGSTLSGLVRLPLYLSTKDLLIFVGA